MTQAQANELPLGLYRIHWKDGGSSLAAVGYNYKGNHWFAPTNWLGNSVPSYEWILVECVIPIKVD